MILKHQEEMSERKPQRESGRAIKDLDGDDARILREALEQLIQHASNSLDAAICVNRTMRHRDFAQSRRPYERLVTLLSSHFERDVVKAALGVINVIFGAPIPEEHHDQLWFVLDRAIYTENIKVRAFELSVVRNCVETAFAFVFLFVECPRC